MKNRKKKSQKKTFQVGFFMFWFLGFLGWFLWVEIFGANLAINRFRFLRYGYMVNCNNIHSCSVPDPLLPSPRRRNCLFPATLTV